MIERMDGLIKEYWAKCDSCGKETKRFGWKFNFSDDAPAGWVEVPNRWADEHYCSECASQLSLSYLSKATVSPLKKMPVLPKVFEPTFKATCTWGEGPDCLLEINEGGKRQWFDLTAKQALDLAEQLIAAWKGAREMELSYEKYQKDHKEAKGSLRTV